MKTPRWYFLDGNKKEQDIIGGYPLDFAPGFFVVKTVKDAKLLVVHRDDIRCDKLPDESNRTRPEIP
jgi:hypothetical protein